MKPNNKFMHEQLKEGEIHSQSLTLQINLWLKFCKKNFWLPLIYAKRLKYKDLFLKLGYL